MDIIDEILLPGYQPHINIGRGTVFYLLRLESGLIVIMRSERCATAPLFDLACVGTSKEDNEAALIEKAKSLSAIFESHNVPADTMVLYRLAQFQHKQLDPPYWASVIFIAILAFKS